MMRDYKLYFLDGQGHIQSFSELRAADDDAAIAQAKALDDRRAMELWELKRKVAEFPAQPF
jgi:hypothetical protein